MSRISECGLSAARKSRNLSPGSLRLIHTSCMCGCSRRVHAKKNPISAATMQLLAICHTHQTQLVWISLYGAKLTNKLKRLYFDYILQEMWLLLTNDSALIQTSLVMLCWKLFMTSHRYLLFCFLIQDILLLQSNTLVFVFCWRQCHKQILA